MRGFTLIDVLVGIVLLVVFFSGIFGLYQLGLKVVAQSQNRIVATALANEYLEMARNLPYADVGVVGSYPTGSFAASQELQRNNKTYTVFMDVDFVADASDGLAEPQDSCINDYKRVVATVLWLGQFPGELSLATDVAPKNAVQECEETGGMLSVLVFDAFGSGVSSSSVQVEDVDTSLTDVCVTNTGGVCQFLLPASPLEGTENYKVVVARSGYSTAQTFRTGDTYNSHVISDPEIPHATLFEGQITEMSLSIDVTGSMTIQTRSSRGTTEFSDEFDNTLKIAESSDIEVIEGRVQLEDLGGVYPSSGSVTSITVADGNIESWGEVSFISAIPADTSFRIQLLSFNNPLWELIEEDDLPGNEAGFSSSPVDISGLDSEDYPELRLLGILETSDPAKTPTLGEWGITYFTQTDFPLGFIPFNVVGDKVVGTDASESPIFKYENSAVTNGSGFTLLSDLEWDRYTFSVDPGATGLSIVEVDPGPQPVFLDPRETATATLYLASENTLLVTVLETGTEIPVFSAAVSLAKTGYEETQATNEEGQTLFIPLDTGLYTLEAAASGYETAVDSVSISGTASFLIHLSLNPE